MKKFVEVVKVIGRVVFLGYNEEDFNLENN